MSVKREKGKVSRELQQPITRKKTERLESQHQLWLSTQEANTYFTPKLPGQRAMVQRVIKHVVTAYRQGQQDSVYAILQVLNWKQWMVQLTTYYQRESLQVEKALAQQFRQQRIKAPYRYQHRIGVGNPLVGVLINLLSQFDHLIWLIECAKNAGIYRSISHYFKVKGGINNRLNRLLSKMVYQPVSKLPKVTIEDYLQQTSSYQKARQRFYTIRPTLLLNALQTTVRPIYPKDKLKILIAQLYLKCRDNQRETDSNTDEKEEI